MKVTAEIARVASGAAWSVAGTILVQVLAFFTAILTARAVPPEAYGVVGMAAVVVVFISTVRDLGLAPAIASGRLSGETAWATAHWALCGVALVSAAVTFACAPVVAGFFRAPLVADVLRVQSPMLLFSAATVVAQARLQHAGRFRALAALAGANQALITAGVVMCVVLRAGVWTLVVPPLVASAVTIPLYWLALRRAPALAFDWRSIARFAREGWHLSAYGVCNYLSRNADNAVIGRFNGERALGLYAFAYMFLIQPLGIFSHAHGPVLLPAFGRVTDRERRSDAIVRAVVTLTRLGAPVFVGGALTAHVFVPLLFGPRWLDAVPLVRVLMLVGAAQIVGPVFGTFVLATGDSRFMLRWGVATGVVSVAVFVAGALLGGPLGVAIGYGLWTIVQVAIMYGTLRRRFALPLHGLGPGVASLMRDLGAMSIAVLLADTAARAWFADPALHLVALVLVGAMVYVAAFRLLARDEVSSIVALLPSGAARIGARVLRVPAPPPYEAE